MNEFSRYIHIPYEKQRQTKQQNTISVEQEENKRDTERERQRERGENAETCKKAIKEKTKRAVQ